ncbi:MAG: response regulator [Candidatus Aminicenantes bacterium]|nr:response regulator [Candidatus Aminicenantes bacterium]
MKRILVVDDIPENIYLLETLLKSYGYEVETGENGAEALDKIKKNLPDLIISDILMPVMDGFALCRKCKEDKKTRNIPFVFYTATYTDHSDEEFALSLGADRFLIKPLDPMEFIKEIKFILMNFSAEKFHGPKRFPEKETVFLKKYNKTLIRKLEKKLLNLEESNATLKKECDIRKKAEEEILKLKEGLEACVDEKTKELNEKLNELERFHDATIEREFRIKELNERIEELETELKKNSLTS